LLFYYSFFSSIGKLFVPHKIKTRIKREVQNKKLLSSLVFAL
jgi:hypothetical protein